VNTFDNLFVICLANESFELPIHINFYEDQNKGNIETFQVISRRASGTDFSRHNGGKTVSRRASDNDYSPPNNKKTISLK
jgi:hypothetical protein